MKLYAWVVEFGKGCHAFFFDHAKAMQFAVNSHGIVREVFVND